MMNRYRLNKHLHSTLVFIALFLFAFSSLSMHASAITTEQKRVFDSGIKYFDVEENVNNDCFNSGDPVTGDGNEEIVWNYLVGVMGFTAIQAAGIMGNIQQESGFNPTIVNPSSGAYGLIQWYAGRETALEEFAREQGKDKGDLLMQLDFMKKELESDYYRSRVLEPMRQATDLAAATRIWLERFEIPCTPGSSACDREMGIRLPFAQNFLTQFGSQTGGAVISNQSSTCSSPEGGTGIGTHGFVFPLRTTKSMLMSMSMTWCHTSQTNCHHDYNAADIFAPTGTEVIAARGGTVVRVKDEGTAARVVIRGDDGNIYYYTHMGYQTVTVSTGQVVTAGTTLGRVGTSADAAGTLEHLHIDILPGDQFDTRPSCSGSGCSSLPFIEIQPALVSAYNNLPE